MCINIIIVELKKNELIKVKSGYVSSLLAGTKHTAHQQEDQTGDELQRNPSGRHHEGQAIQRCDLCAWTGLSSLLEDVALHLHRLHPQHEQEQHEEEQAGWEGDQTEWL